MCHVNLQLTQKTKFEEKFHAKLIATVETKQAAIFPRIVSSNG